MSHLFRTPCAVLHNVYLGLCVLAAELYWLVGPDLAGRWEAHRLDAAVRRARARLLRSPEGDSEALSLRTALHVSEAEAAAARLRHARTHAELLERVRSRCRVTEH